MKGNLQLQPLVEDDPQWKTTFYYYNLIRAAVPNKGNQDEEQLFYVKEMRTILSMSAV